MRKPNYSRDKRARELAKQSKREAKREKKQQRSQGGTADEIENENQSQS